MKKHVASRPIALLVAGVLVLLSSTCDSGTVAPERLVSPVEWRKTRYPANPVVRIAMNPEETISQYVPAVVLLSNGQVWMYVKGDLTKNISAYSSVDGGLSFEFRGVAVPRGGAGEWDSEFVVDPAAVYDPATSTIHLWYKGRARPEEGISWGYATADAADPVRFAKHSGNPILSPADIQRRLGERNVSDNYLTDVVRIGGRFHFYGGFSSDEGYKTFLALGHSWHDPVPDRVLMTPEAGTDLVQCPYVIRHPYADSYLKFYTVGFDADLDPTLGRRLRVASSADGVRWTPLPGVLLEPDTTISWEAKRVYCASVLRHPGSSAPVLRDGRMQIYYSGSSRDHRDQVGLLHLFPEPPE